MGRKWTMQIAALGGRWTYLAMVDEDSGVWEVVPDTYNRQDNGMTIEELELALSASQYHDDTTPGGFGIESRHAEFVMRWRPGSKVLEVNPPYEFDPDVIY